MALKLSLSGAGMAILLIGALLLQGCQQDVLNLFHPRNPPTPKGIDMKLITDGFVSPIGLVAVSDNSKRLFVIDQIGKILIIDKYGKKLSTPFLDVSSRLVALNPNNVSSG
ncbi:MAG: hypothetical protein ICV81_10910 [Flavisolibacter sp.]|nr:hypothetical protein [Flavisolibacter sp.]